MGHIKRFFIFGLWVLGCSYFFLVIYNEAKANAIRELNAQQWIFARQAAEGIETLVEHWLTYLTTASKKQNIADLDALGKEEMNFTLESHRHEIRAVTRVDEKGVVLYSTPNPGEFTGADISGQKHVQRLLASQKPVVSDVFRAIQGYDAIALHVPAFKNGGFAGSLGVLLDFKYISKRYLEVIRIGKTGYAWMVSQGGIELYCPVPGHVGNSVFDNCKDFPTILAMAEQMVRGEKGETVYLFDGIREQKLETIKKHAVFMPIRIGGTFWSLVVASSEDEILASLKGFKNKLIFLFLLILAGSILLAYSAMKAWGVVKEAELKKEAEKALEFERSQLLSVFDAMPAVVNVVDPVTYELLFMNKYAKDLYKKQNIGDLCYRVFHNRIAPCDHCPNEALLDSDPEKYLDGEYYSKTLQRHFMTTNKLLKWPDGRTAKFELAIDITERKKAENALMESEQRFRKVFQHMGTGVAIYEAVNNGTDFIFKDINPAGAKMGGIERGAHINRSVRDVYPGVVDFGLFQVLQHVWETGSPREFPLKKYQDERIRLWVDNYIFKLPSGEIVALYDDITAQKAAENRSRQLEGQLRQTQRLEAIGALAGGIAHDFNNILYPIIGFAEMMQEDLPKDSLLKEPVDEILHAGLRARDLVKQILTFSRQADKEIRPVKIHLILEEVLGLIRSSLPKNIEIITEINKDTHMIMADPTQIHQIIMNLATNAYHAMEEKGGTLAIKTRNATLERNKDFPEVDPGAYTLIQISDTGQGMDVPTLEKIFDPYFTTKSMEKGTGLGLSVVYGIVKSYKGAITVESKPEQGTVFNVFLPAYASEPIETEGRADQTAPGGHERVLLVDDEEAIAGLLNQMLTRMGYRVGKFTSPGEALEHFQANPEEFDILISDMAMPFMTGDRLAVEMMKIRPDFPVIIFTGFSEQLTHARIQSLGIKGVLFKPVIKSELALMLRKVLDEQKAAADTLRHTNIPS